MAESKPAKIIETKLVSVDSLRAYRNNAKQGDVEAIRESIRVNGMYRPVVVWQKTQEILAGNHTWMAVKEEGLTEIWATFIECDAERAARINLADNRTSELGGYDEALLMAQLGSLPDLVGTGYTGSDLDSLRKKLGEGSDSDDDGLGAVPEDEYEAQFGVIVMCESQGQQKKVFEALQAITLTNKDFEDTELKVVAV